MNNAVNPFLIFPEAPVGTIGTATVDGLALPFVVTGTDLQTGKPVVSIEGTAFPYVVQDGNLMIDPTSVITPDSVVHRYRYSEVFNGPVTMVSEPERVVINNIEYLRWIGSVNETLYTIVAEAAAVKAAAAEMLGFGDTVVVYGPVTKAPFGANQIVLAASIRRAH